MKWSPYEYYTSSPQEFYYACMGYFDERDSMNELMRSVAKFSCAGYVKGNDFDRAWPSINKEKVNNGVDAEMAAMIQRVHDVLNKQKAS